MNAESFYLLAADAVLLVHWMFVAFVVVGLLLILLGGALGWGWVRKRRFRVLHLVGIGYVTVQAWFGLICPLTHIENALRARAEGAGAAAYSGAFIAHWLDEWLYIDAPMWMFAVAYTLFAGLVAGSWMWVRPNARMR